MQYSFSRLWDGFKSDKEAIQARNQFAKELKAKGKNIRKFSIPNQLKQYDGLGQDNGGVCTVYFVETN